MLPQPESNIPLIGDWTTVYKGRKMQQLPASSSKREDIPSSSSNKSTSYKEVAVNNPPQEKLDYFENPVTEKNHVYWWRRYQNQSKWWMIYQN